ncbi:mpv17-like protein [Coccinella septempunctata]|uniref:mpv17-like protein n=1 Tax=Coccinella septempunctata TaxID=41139 RepID=UPI001D08DC75|nr:mpv17-like protein [Coccinella septempunctata]
MGRLLKTIRKIFYKYPIISNSVIYGSLCVGAEVSQQTVQKKLLKTPPEKYDPAVIGRYAIYGTTIAGPLLTVWYQWLDKLVVGKTLRVAAKKVLIDQFIMTPQLLIIFFVAMSFMENKENVFEECKQKYLVTFKNSCMFWLPVQSLNFLVIPSSLRVLYVGICSFAWINILCWIKRTDSSSN